MPTGQVTRRVVTAVDAEGKSYFALDEPTPHVFDLGLVEFHEIWADDGQLNPKNPTDLLPKEKAVLHPPAGGSIFRVFTIHPQAQVEITPERMAALREQYDDGGVHEMEDPAFHTTATIDYVLILSGEIDLELDEGTVHLAAGDVVVQRATRHAWRAGDQPCVMAAVLVSAPV